MNRPFAAMFRHARSTVLQARPQSLIRRQFSAKAIYSSFPATLYYYAPRSTSSLFDIKEYDERPHDLHVEGVTVDPSGLVYPGLKDTVSNGAVMFPNTFNMQELNRMFSDFTLDWEDEGFEAETPFIYTIARGTPIPSHLILINEYEAMFALQPSRGMRLQELNQSLDEFYAQYAQKEPARSWLEAHAYQDAVADDEETVWMAK